MSFVLKEYYFKIVISILEYQIELMTPFFKRIRRQLANDNQILKYSRYAIGEILLVVVGILIALQLNNWNETRKQDIKQSIYLTGLKADFELSKIAVERVIKKTDRVAKSIDTLVALMKKKGDVLTLIQIDSLFNRSSGFTVLMPSEGVISDIISSGKLDMIKNTGLRNKIASWEADLRMIRENEILSKKVSSGYNDHISQYFDYTNFKFGKPAFLDHKRSDFLNDNIMNNYLFDKYQLSIILNELYREKSKDIDSLIAIIDSELK